MEIVKISAIKANSKNPRVIKDDKFRKLVQSIREFPDMLNKRPLICFTDVDKKYVVLGGNMRLKAAQEIGLKEMPIILADDWTQEQKDEFLIKDNVGFGEWNWDDLANEWDAELLDKWGLDIPNFDKEVLEAEEDDFDTTPPEISITVLGDLYEIGEHRLLCGDSTDSDQVAKLMNGQKGDMVFTDPPYNVDYLNANRPKPSKINFGKIKNDVMSVEAFKKFVTDILNNLFIYTKNDSSLYFWYASASASAILASFINSGWKRNQEIIWKKPMLLGRGKYQWAHEPCIFALKGNPYFTNDRTKTTVWDFGGYDKSKNQHPTQKPVILCNEGINNSSIENEIIIDLFLGSGSTMVASHQLKRKCFGMELDPKYCDVIVNRMIALDRDIKIKLNGKPFEKAY